VKIFSISFSENLLSCFLCSGEEAGPVPEVPVHGNKNAVMEDRVLKDLPVDFGSTPARYTIELDDSDLDFENEAWTDSSLLKEVRTT
jgi:hypothetical protein